LLTNKVFGERKKVHGVRVSNFDPFNPQTHQRKNEEVSIFFLDLIFFWWAQTLGGRVYLKYSAHKPPHKKGDNLSGFPSKDGFCSDGFFLLQFFPSKKKTEKSDQNK